MRARFAAELLAATLAAALALPGVSLAQGPSNPLAPGLPQPTGSVPTTSTPLVAPTTSSSTSSGGLSSSSAAAIALGAIIVLSGISFFIWRDARRRAPVRARATDGGGSRPGSKRPVKPRKLSPAERRRRKRGRAR